MTFHSSYFLRFIIGNFPEFYLCYSPDMNLFVNLYCFIIKERKSFKCCIILVCTDLKPENAEGFEDLNDPRVRLKRDCVGIMAAFKPVDCSEHLVIVANTHLYW